MTMTRIFSSLPLLLALLSSANADSSTTVTVLELGKGGVVRRTTSPSSHTTVSGVSSLWNSLHDIHGPKSKRQQPGMILVPDLFQKADGGLVVGISGMDLDLLDAMPTVRDLLKKKEEGEVVGHMELSGAQGHKLMKRSFDDLSGNIQSKAREVITKGKNTVQAVKVDLEDRDQAAKFDSDLAATLQTIREKTQDDTTLLVHLVVEHNQDKSNHRRLSNQQQQRRLDEEEEDEEEEENDDADDANNNNNQNQYNGQGYYNDYGEWVTNYKTAFQIQYFNVVLWTSLGLAVVLFSTVGMMIYMPLMPDTLLFGESAKFTGA